MLKRLRIAVLLYVLLFVAAAQFFTSQRMTDWDAPLWVDVYTVAGDDTDTTRRYLDGLAATEFNGVEAFLNREAQRHGVQLEQPFEVQIVGEHRDPLPSLDSTASGLDVLWWSLQMRWLATRLRWQQEGPSGDIMVFAVFHEPSAGVALDRSTALEKGLVAVANLFADRTARGSNQIVFAHELLHTLGASDKYAPGSNLPLFPEGYASPDARPLLPQAKAELMAGRRPTTNTEAETPDSLGDVVVGTATALEIGWRTL